MKALFITLLIFAAAFAGYDYFVAPPGQKMIFKALNVAVEEAPPAIVAPSEAPKPADTDNKPAKTVADAPPTTATAPATATATATATAPATSTPPEPKADPNAFPTPHYDSLDVLSKNWTMIPKSAFPRQVHLRKAIPFRMSVGTSTINAGAEVTALGFDTGLLTLAPAATSSARATAAVDDTDLKSVLNENYERWKAIQTDLRKKAFDRRLANRGKEDAAPASGGDPAATPSRANDGTYPVLVAHLNSGEVNEIKLKNIHNWGDAIATQWEGKPAWSVKVQFDAETVFGLQPTEAQAIISGGRVKGWFYTGSGEPVP
jgi:hypothetical protein